MAEKSGTASFIQYCTITSSLYRPCLFNRHDYPGSLFLMRQGKLNLCVRDISILNVCRSSVTTGSVTCSFWTTEWPMGMRVSVRFKLHLTYQLSQRCYGPAWMQTLLLSTNGYDPRRFDWEATPVCLQGHDSIGPKNRNADASHRYNSAEKDRSKAQV